MVLAEPIEAYMQRNAVKSIFTDLTDTCCRDLPEPGKANFTAFLIATLCEKFPSAAKAVETVPKWVPAKRVFVEKIEMNAYLEELRWKPVSQALLEKMIYERPTDVPEFLVGLLAKGSVVAESIPPTPR